MASKLSPGEGTANADGDPFAQVVGKWYLHRSQQGWVNGKNTQHNPNNQLGTSLPNGLAEDQFIFFFHPDHLGSTSFVTDRDGELYEHVGYFPFGETWVEQASNTENIPYLFTGKELDQETGLYYFGARYYDPRTSVWQSADPGLGGFLGSTKGYNPVRLSLYAYGANNPLRMTDPNGADFWEFASGVKQAFINDLVPAYTRAEGIYDAAASGDAAGAGMQFGQFAGEVAVGSNGLSVGWAFGGELQQLPEQAVTAITDPSDFRAGLATGAGLKTAVKAVGFMGGIVAAGEAAAAETLSTTARLAQAEELAGRGGGGGAGGGGSGGGGGRSVNKLRPDPTAEGAHSTWKRDALGRVSGHAEWQPNARNPSGFNEAKRVDTQYANPHVHYNKATGQPVPTPHAHDPLTAGGVRAARPDELPQ
jgi:RHS repeat-associated protein